MAEDLKNYEKWDRRKDGLTQTQDRWWVCQYEIPEAKRDALLPNPVASIEGQRLPLATRSEGCNLPDVAYDAQLGPYVRKLRSVTRIPSDPKAGRGALLLVVIEGRKLTPLT